MSEEVSVNTYIGQEFGNYRLTRLIGRGGFAEVYLGEHIYLKTQAAIKILQTRLSDDEQERFYAEARTVAHLQHEYIVRVLEFGLKDGNIPYLVMEYAPDGTLRERFPRGNAMPLTHILPSFKQVAAALQYAHEQHLVHRDIKPENMLLGTHGEVLLSDFGIALMIKGSQRQDAQEVAGTVTYMAPEQLMGQPTQASDQYALGVVVYEWLCGQRLFTGSFTSIATQHMLAPPTSLKERNPDIPASVDRVVLKVLAKDPQQRFSSVQDFAHALEAAAQGDSNDGADATCSTAVRASTAYKTPVLTAPVQQQGYASSKSHVQSSARKLKIILPVVALLLVIGSILAFSLLHNNQPMKTNTPPDMYALYSNATRGEPQIQDSLRAEGPLAWQNGTANTCKFQDNTLHVANKGVALCNTAYTNLNDFAYQAEMTIIQGTNGGLIFRNELLPDPNGGVYYFTVTAQGQFSLSVRKITYIDGQFSSSPLKTLLQHQSTAIKTGLHQTNLLTVIARGSTIALYINKQFVGSAQDTTSLSGTIGLFSQGNAANQVLEVTFKNLQVWNL
ncbi:hypothetical protein KDA_38040 [Dictyobacter alpinus]|uniref:Protein kinase domain-containing protein n=1 Tax=Dictyobacter alpinus TaxID=2014873 RepID=A0A402BAI7_9CHLR|nr:serine/threonine-protein kinase [Dictyobacter alpinus]GCE28320.1 hypothetical protein KDA_38040 [Dictyobacter alpinus]